MVKRNLKLLYKGVCGFFQDAGDAPCKGLALTYGELTPVGVSRMLDYLQMNRQDVFYDLGSGVGRAVLQVSMTASIRKSAGIEIVEARNKAAKRVLSATRKQAWIKSRAVVFRQESLLETDLKDVTVVYVASTCFSGNFMTKIARKLINLQKAITLVSLREFERKHRGFDHVKTLTLPCTWSRRVTAHVHRINGS